MTMVLTYYDTVQDIQTLISNRLDSEVDRSLSGYSCPSPGDVASTYLGD